MTDSSSKDELADITAELIHSKMENARASTQMTHVLRIGSFHMELVPAPEIDVREMFNEILDFAISKGFVLWKGNVSPTPVDGDYFLIKSDIIQ